MARSLPFSDGGGVMHDPSNNNSDVVNIGGGEGDCSRVKDGPSESSHPPLGNERIDSAWNVTMK